jgi:hypothetical protein
MKTFRQDKIGLFGGIYPVNRGIPFKPLAFSAPNLDKPESKPWNRQDAKVAKKIFQVFN